MQKPDTVKQDTHSQMSQGRQTRGAGYQGRRFPAQVELKLLLDTPLIVSFSASVPCSVYSPAPVEVSAVSNVRTSVEMEAVLLGMIQSFRVLWVDPVMTHCLSV